MGLPHRFQLDLYFVPVKEYSEDGDVTLIGEEKIELRWALAKWGAIPANPTLYFEYCKGNSSDKLEAKLLLADELATGVHWGANAVIEKPFGEDVIETAGTLGLSYTVKDEKFSIGAELEFKAEFEGGETSTDLYIGPSIQFRPLAQMHVDIAPLIKPSELPAAKIIAVTGWEF
ncbi:MAG: hypothetical protein O3A46_11560 [Candidatus Poribacteria bacterium]|nr:hypothetical protein [Candidatus Poribacteria bacterium]